MFINNIITYKLKKEDQEGGYNTNIYLLNDDRLICKILKKKQINHCFNIFLKLLL